MFTLWMESLLLDSWLTNNHVTVDIIYYLHSLLVSVFSFFGTSFSFQTYFSTALILEGADTGTKKEELDTAFYTFEWTARIHGIGFRKWRNKKNYEVKIKKVNFPC